MENYSALLGLIAAILGLVLVIMKLIVTNKQIRRETALEKRRLEEENLEKLKLLHQQKEQEESRNEILQISMNIISNYLEKELPKILKDYATAEQLKALDKEMKYYLAKQLKLLEKTGRENGTSRKQKVEKTIAEAFGIEISNQTIQSNGFESFFSDRVERRIKKHDKIK